MKEVTTNFRGKSKILEEKQSKNFMKEAKIKTLEGNHNKNFRKKPKLLQVNQKFWNENKINFRREVKKIGKEIWYLWYDRKVS